MRTYYTSCPALPTLTSTPATPRTSPIAIADNAGMPRLRSSKLRNRFMDGSVWRSQSLHVSPQTLPRGLARGGSFIPQFPDVVTAGMRAKLKKVNARLPVLEAAA